MVVLSRLKAEPRLGIVGRLPHLQVLNLLVLSRQIANLARRREKRLVLLGSHEAEMVHPAHLHVAVQRVVVAHGIVAGTVRHRHPGVQIESLPVL